MNHVSKMTQLIPQTTCSKVISFASPGGGKRLPENLEDLELQRVLALSLKEHTQASANRKAAAAALQRQIPDDSHIQSVIGDGACLFRAFARSLFEQTGIRKNPVDLRKECVQNIEQTQVLINRFDSHQDATEYLNAMAMDTTYGDELCVHSLALLFFRSRSGIHTQLWRAGILHRIFTNCQTRI